MSGGPVLLVQLSDPHIRVGSGDDASARALAAAVRAVAELVPAPEAVLVSGDVAEHGSASEYERARELLAPLAMPVHVLAGNHDDPDALRAGLGGLGGELVEFAARCGPLRLVGCDTTLPGRDDGGLGEERLAWLEDQLASEPDVQTVIAMHHPPLLTGMEAMDVLGLPEADRGALGELVGRHPQVQRIVAGHVHRAIAGSLGGVPVVTSPSVHLQLLLDLRSGARLELAPDPPAFLMHMALDGGLNSHVQPLVDGDRA